MTSSIALAVATVLLSADPDPFAKWEKEITGIEKRLKDKPPAKGGVFFAGSSSTRLWKLDKSFPGMNYVNVGFGGSEIRDTTHFAERILLPFEPSNIILYAGDNDIAKKRTPEQLRDDFSAFVKIIHAKLPKTRILFLPVKPSIARWSMYETQKSANGMIQKICESSKLLGYIDIVPVTLGEDGKPKPEFFVKDGLHLSEAGYAAWTKVVIEALKKSKD